MNTSPRPGIVGLRDVAIAISDTMRAFHYDPAVLAGADYAEVERHVEALARDASTTEEFIEGFNAIWSNGPFSHVILEVGTMTADETAAHLDAIRVGGDPVRLEWDGAVAVLTVTTMMGLDTIEQITHAYREIKDRSARALIIDLRENRGGAFAIRPLVGHTTTTSLDPGIFVSQRWAAEHAAYPTREEMHEIEPWDGWSIVAFWRDVQDNGCTRLRFDPLSPIFTGPVLVLVSERTKSAAELVADALQGAGRAVLVGETTAGQMLSQKMYDVPLGLILSLPIADYYAFNSGRIEGSGVRPDVATDSDSALSVALELATG